MNPSWGSCIDKDREKEIEKEEEWEGQGMWEGKRRRGLLRHRVKVLSHWNSMNNHINIKATSQERKSWKCNTDSCRLFISEAICLCFPGRFIYLQSLMSAVMWSSVGSPEKLFWLVSNLKTWRLTDCGSGQSVVSLSTQLTTSSKLLPNQFKNISWTSHPAHMLQFAQELIWVSAHDRFLIREPVSVMRFESYEESQPLNLLLFTLMIKKLSAKTKNISNYNEMFLKFTNFMWTTNKCCFTSVHK